MEVDNAFVAAKLRRWEKYLNNYRLPSWEVIPEFGLYMEQVISLLTRYLDYLPPELKDEEFITAATINNYVRIRAMPKPSKKKYYRIHIAYLIVICTLKQGLSLSLIQKLMPVDIPEDEVRDIYTAYVQRHRLASEYFVEQVRKAAAPILDHASDSALASDRVSDLITFSAAVGNFSRLLSEKLLLLEGKPIDVDIE